MSKFYNLLNELFYFNQKKSSPEMKLNLSQACDKNDKFILKIILCYWLTSTVLTVYFDTYVIGIIGGGIISVLAWVGYRFFSGINRRFILCLCLCLFSGLFIYQQPGYVEPHFSFYASMYTLTRYKDVKPLFIFICLTVLYYLSFTYLQSRAESFYGLDIQLFPKELWDSLRFHLLAFLTSSCVFIIIIRNHIIDFYKSQLLQSDLLSKKQSLSEDVSYRTKQLYIKTENLKAMLNSLSEGVLIIGQDKCIKDEYSLFVEKIFDENNLAGKPALDILFKNSNLTSNEVSNAKLLLESSLDKPLYHFEKNKHLLVEQYSIKSKQSEKHLQIQWTPICNDNGLLTQILVSIFDCSLIKRLNKDNEYNTRKLQLIGEVLMVEQNVLSEFMNYSNLALKQMSDPTSNNQPEALEQNLLNLNQMKKRALEYGLIYFTRKLQEFEICLNNFKIDENLIGNVQHLSKQHLLFQSLIEEYNTLNLKLERTNIKQDKDELAIDKRAVESLLEKISDIKQSNEDELTASLMAAKQYISSLSEEWAEQ